MQNLQLTAITIPSSLKSIQGSALSGNQIANLVIPASVNQINQGALSNCFVNIQVESGNGNYTAINNTCLLNSSNELIAGSINLTEIPDGIKSIGQGAFTNCSNLQSISIPSSVKSIGVQAFQSCSNLNSVTLSEGLQYIEQQAFNNCRNLHDITIPTTVSTIDKNGSVRKAS